MHCRCSSGECPLPSNAIYQPFYFNARWLYKQDSLTNAGDALLSDALFNSSDLWNPVKKSCGGNDPILLGTCEFDENSPIPSSLTLWNAVEEDKNTFVELIFVLYRACSPNSLRFYNLLPPEFTSGAPRPRDFFSELAQYDFTRPQCKNIDQALNEVVINQVCIQRFFSLKSSNIMHRSSMHHNWSKASYSDILQDCKPPKTHPLSISSPEQHHSY